MTCYKEKIMKTPFPSLSTQDYSHRGTCHISSWDYNSLKANTAFNLSLCHPQSLSTIPTGHSITTCQISGVSNPANEAAILIWFFNTS